MSDVIANNHLSVFKEVFLNAAEKASNLDLFQQENGTQEKLGSLNRLKIVEFPENNLTSEGKQLGGNTTNKNTGFSSLGIYNRMTPFLRLYKDVF